MAIPKIRAGNDFVYVWAIERNGVAVDLTAATTVRLSYGVGKPCNYYTEIPFEIIDGNKVRSSHNYENTGTYNLRLEFTLAGVDSTVDIDAFAIVPRSALASEATDFAVTSDMAIGFKGDSAYQIWLDEGNTGTIEDYLADIKGDPLTYDDLTPEQIAELQQPATDAIASIQEVELAVETAEGLRVQAELNRQSDTATAIFNAEQATDNANNAALLANEKAGLANDAALLANEKAGLAATATTQANAARDGANSAAQSATNLVDSYATELAAKELKANKQNSLAVDGTGTKFPTVDAVNAKIGAMSGELIANYTHTSNKEVHISSIDYDTNTFTSVGHGLSNSVSDYTALMLAINRNELIYPYNVMPFANLTGYIPYSGFWVINATPDTFQLSFTNGGSAITLLNKAETDLTKWHFEYNTATKIEITGLLGKINRGCRAVIDGSFCRFGSAYIGCPFGGKTYYKGVGAAIQEAAFSFWSNSEIPIPSFGGVVVHTDYYTPSGHRKLLDVAIYSYTPTLNRIAFLQKVQNNISPVAIPDASKNKFSIEGGAMIANGTNIKLYTI